MLAQERKKDTRVTSASSCWPGSRRPCACRPQRGLQGSGSAPRARRYTSRLQRRRRWQVDRRCQKDTRCTIRATKLRGSLERGVIGDSSKLAGKIRIVLSLIKTMEQRWDIAYTVKNVKQSYSTLPRSTYIGCPFRSGACTGLLRYHC